MLLHLLRRSCGVIVAALATPVAALAGLLAYFGSAFVIVATPAAAILGVLATAATAYGVVRLAASLLAINHRRRAAVLVAIAATAVCTGLFTATVLRPGPHPSPGPVPAGVRFWALPTGSRIAYVHRPADGTARPTPVLFLHGGPGTPGEGLPPAAEALAVEGFDVYAYDQLGAGRSTRLHDVTGYTVARQVADLDAIRVGLGAEQMILIGQSWGGSLAAQYLAAHPAHVARVVFTSPGPIWPAAHPDGGAGDPWARMTAEQRAARDTLLSNPRVAAQVILQQINPNAAHALIGDDEADELLHRIAVLGKDTTGCPGAPPALVHGNHQGFYVNQMTVADFARIPDPRPALRATSTPALIVRGICDFIPWAVTSEYRTVLPHATLVVVPDAGHAVAVGAPQLYPTLLTAFLTDRSLPVPLYTSPDEPR